MLALFLLYLLVSKHLVEKAFPYHMHPSMTSCTSSSMVATNDIIL